MRTRRKTVESWGDNQVPDPHGNLVVNGVTLTSACGAVPLSPSPTAAAHSPRPTPPEATYHSPRSPELPALRPQLRADDHRSREVRRQSRRTRTFAVSPRADTEGRNAKPASGRPRVRGVREAGRSRPTSIPVKANSAT